MRGTTCASLQNNSDNSSMSKPAETPYLTQNTERFSNDFYAPGDMQDATLSCAAVQHSYSLKVMGVCLRVSFQAGIDVRLPNSCLLSW